MEAEVRTRATNSTSSSQAGSVQACQNCKIDFTIEPEDFTFYANLKVPPPTWCSKCRLIRRLAWRDGRTMHKIKCGLCKKDTFSMFAQDSGYTVYCRNCWWSDSWSSRDYGRDYDFNTPFFVQFDKLLKEVPRPATNHKNSPTSPFCNNVTRCKNCYLVFGGYIAENCMYGEPILSKASLDSEMLLNGDHAYETVSCTGVFNVSFSYYVDETLNSSFMFDCKGCNDCFGCVNLRNKNYYIFNQPYSKEEYKEKIKEWDLGSYRNLLKARKKFREFYLSIPHRFAVTSNVENVSGNDIQYARNCKECFSVANGIDNCRFVFFGGMNLKDSYDVTAFGDNAQLCYESHGALGTERALFSKTCSESRDVQYCEMVRGCSDLFGCANMINKKYCILNKQYTKEEYHTLKYKIIQHMKIMPYVNEEGISYSYGENFPIEMSPLPYNEAWVQAFFPLVEKEALRKGYKWSSSMKRSYVITKKSEDLPDHIKDVPDDIVREIIACEHGGKCDDNCATAFRIMPDELTFYRARNIALPRLCPNCRYVRRIRWTSTPKLWLRGCMCAGMQSDTPSVEGQQQYVNKSEHQHGSEPCLNEFETVIASDRKEIVYCQQCYNDEFL